MSSIYQSNGACEKTCANYALGVLQGSKCWCSNVAPAESDQKSVSECSTGCPGYPNDSCGSAAQGVFAYVQIVGNDVTSTASGGSTSTSTTSSVSSPANASLYPIPFALLPPWGETLSLFMFGRMLVHGIVSHERSRPPALRQPVLLLPAHFKLYLFHPLGGSVCIANS